jgi:hypothetical protein
VRDVYVDSSAIVRNRRAVGIDYDAARELQDAQRRAANRAGGKDTKMRSFADLAPYSLPFVQT